MYEDHQPWENGVPTDLHPAVKHLRKSFDDAHFNFGRVTRNLCYSLLHPDDASEDSSEYAKALVQLKARIGPAASQRFNETLAQKTPSAIFKGLFDFYLEGLGVQVLLIFKALAEIGRVNEDRLCTPHLEWAESQAKHLIGSNIHLIDIWVRAVCDTDPYDPEEDWDERINRTKWQAPRFLIMKPSRYEPYDAARAWERVDAETSMRWRKMFYEEYVRRLESKLKNLAGQATVELAMQPKTQAQSATVIPLIPPDQEYVAESRPHLPRRSSELRQGDTIAHPTAEQWRVLREQFAMLAGEEKNEIASGRDPFISATCVREEGTRNWSIRRPNRDRGSRFGALATQAALLLGEKPDHCDLLDAWMESLCLDLFQQRNEGMTVTSLRFARKPGDSGIIERVCEESATFCARLETKAYAHDEARAEKLPSSPKATPNVLNGRGEATRESLLKQIKNAPDGKSFRTEFAARALEVSRRTVQRKVKDQELTKGAKRGTVTASSLRRLLKLKRPTGASQYRPEPNQ